MRIAILLGTGDGHALLWSGLNRHQHIRAAASRGKPKAARYQLCDKLACESTIFIRLWPTGESVTQAFNPGDDLVFQLESGFGLLRLLAVDNDGTGPYTWHLLAYEELFPDVASAEAALAKPEHLHTRVAHMALTDRAFERTPVARLGNRPVTNDELSMYRDWQENAGTVSDRSALLMLGFR